MSRATSAALSLTTLIIASLCSAESDDRRYVVLDPGVMWTYEYRFWEEGRFPMEQVCETVTWIDGIAEWGGYEYYRMRTKTTGFSNAADGEQLIRVTGDGVRVLDVGKASPEEVLQLPLPAVPGVSWSVAEGDETWHYTLESSEPAEVPAGRFEDCAAVLVTLESETSKFDISMRTKHCGRVGLVGYRTKAKHEYGVSNGVNSSRV